MDAIDLAFYRRQGHLTVNGVFSAAETDALIADVEAWGETFLGDLPAEQRGWYIDGGVKARTVLRKLDNPHAHRPAVQEVARDPRLVALVEQVLGARSSSRHPRAAARSRRTRTTSTSARATSTASSRRGSRSTTRRSKTAASTSAKARTRASSTTTSRRPASRSTCSCLHRYSTSSRWRRRRFARAA